jgi:hypothetical protein
VSLRLYTGDAPEASSIRLRDGAEINLEPSSTGAHLSISGPERHYRITMPHRPNFAVDGTRVDHFAGEGAEVTGPGSFDLTWST